MMPYVMDDSMLWFVIFRDEGRFVIKNRSFPSLAEAEAYASTIAPSREPFVALRCTRLLRDLEVKGGPGGR